MTAQTDLVAAIEHAAKHLSTKDWLTPDGEQPTTVALAVIAGVIDAGYVIRKAGADD